MHGATVEDEWCAKQKIFLRRVYLSVGVHHCFRFCLSGLHSLCSFTSKWWEIIFQDSHFVCHLYGVLNWRITLGFFCIFNASLQPPTAQEQSYCEQWLNDSESISEWRQTAVYHIWSVGFQPHPFNYVPHFGTNSEMKKKNKTSVNRMVLSEQLIYWYDNGIIFCTWQKACFVDWLRYVIVSSIITIFPLLLWLDRFLLIAEVLASQPQRSQQRKFSKSSTEQQADVFAQRIKS